MHVDVLIMAMRSDPYQNSFLDIVGRVDLRHIIIEYLPIASCPALLSAHRALTPQDVGLIETLGERLHHGFEKEITSGNFKTTVKVEITPYYKERIPHWQLIFSNNVRACAPDVLVATVHITSLLGSFAQVGKFMWNRDHNVDVFVVDCINEAAYMGANENWWSDKFTNREIRTLHRLNYGLLDLFSAKADQCLSPTILNTTVSFRKQKNIHHPNNAMQTNRSTLKNLKFGLELCNPHKRSIMSVGVQNEDYRSAIDSKPNAPFVTNLKLKLDESEVPPPYKTVLAQSFRRVENECSSLNHNTSAIFASFGVAAVVKPTYPNLLIESRSRLNEIVAKLIGCEAEGFNSLPFNNRARFLEQDVHFEFIKKPPLF